MEPKDEPSSHDSPGRETARRMSRRRQAAVAAAAAVSAALVILVPMAPAAIAGEAAVPLQVDFAPAGSTPAAGFVLDHGQQYGPRTEPSQGENLVYGWVLDGTPIPLALTGSARERAKTGLTDTKLTTFVQMGGPGEQGSWEVKIADGWYAVAVGLGDAAANYDSYQSVTAEGVQVVEPYAPADDNRLRSGTAVVKVADGRLTVRADGGTNVKISYLTVAAVPAPSDSAVDVRVDFGAVSSAPAPGSLLDYGQPFGPRPSGEFGWLRAGGSVPLDLEGRGRQRSLPASDPRLENFVHMQGLTADDGRTLDADWGMTVPNGAYRVTVATGDAGNNYDSEHAITVEDVPAIKPFAPTFTSKFMVRAVDVQVTDTVLTISADGGTNTKLDYVEVRSLDAADGALVPLAITTPAG